MAIQQIVLTFDDINTSAQVGDIIYYSKNPQSMGGFDRSRVYHTYVLGPIVEINGNSINVHYDDTSTSPPPAGSFISFVKDKKVNTTSLLGYYAQVKLKNDSTDKAELFSVGSEISQSSE